MRNFPSSYLLILALLPGCTPVSPLAWWHSVNHKAAELASLEARYVALEHEHEHLKEAYYKMEHEHADLRARLESREQVEVNLAETGSARGRTPASLHYDVPKGLKPEELKSLAYEHYREGRFGAAAVSFEAFLTSPEAADLHDADAMYTAGVAWYKLGNYTKAVEQLNAARANGAGEQKEKVRKKVDLWLRVIDHERGEKGVKG